MQTLTPPGNVIDIATNAYGRHVLYLMDNGDVYGTGYNYYGQLGDGTTTTSEGFKK
jgi:alpha-tubulin suppressor-like RCC1 family protein